MEVVKLEGETTDNLIHRQNGYEKHIKNIIYFLPIGTRKDTIALGVLLLYE